MLNTVHVWRLKHVYRPYFEVNLLFSILGLLKTGPDRLVQLVEPVTRLGSDLDKPPNPFDFKNSLFLRNC